MQVEVGLLGCGTVGSGVVELMHKRADKIAEMTGVRATIKKILVLDLNKPREVLLNGELLTTRPEDILQDPGISVIIETIGGIEPARTLLLQAVRAGKHVITANKDLIALYGAEILEEARKASVDVYYEAAVGGAIPLIRPLKESLTANEITEIKGIINGTTNYILSKMTRSGANYEDVLAEAQALGYAEADPSSDVDGLDAARKLTILSTIAFHTKVSLDDVRVYGIRSVAATDVRYASELGYVIKLLAQGTDHTDCLTLSVRPTLIPKDHPLAYVSDAYNALYVHGDASGDLMFFGRGAGSLPTASAVLGDAIDVFRNMNHRVSGLQDQTYLENKPVCPTQASAQPFYLRLTVLDQSGVFAQIAGIFGESDINMETVMQKRGLDRTAEIVIVTHAVQPHIIDHVVAILENHTSVTAVHLVMPVETA